MNVASLELCKELYELSGWDGTHVWSRYDELHWSGQSGLTGSPYSFNESKDIPAYDLGYLLRKLPNSIGDYQLYLYRHANDYWIASYGGTRHIIGIPSVQSRKYPEDAAAKLAIELFKQGILTK